ncbi:unnamed protein product [Camellia sinensis]
MSGRNRGPPLPMKGVPHGGLPPVHEPPFGRDHGPIPHPALLEEMRESQFRMGPRQVPPHPAIIEEHLASQHQEIQGLLVDNQRLAATHVALKQELEAARHELQRMAHYASSLHAEKDMQMRELYEKSVKMEMDLGGAEAMRAELQQVHADVKELTATKQELTAQVQAMTQDLARVTADLQQAPALKEEIDFLKQELQRARAAIEYEKKGYTENYEHGQVMENKLISMARELEKLRAEMANAEKRARAAAAVGNPGYNGTYGNPEAGYAGNPYPASYGMNPMNPDRLVQKAILSMDLDLVLGVLMTCSELTDRDRVLWLSSYAVDYIVEDMLTYYGDWDPASNSDSSYYIVAVDDESTAVKYWENLIDCMKYTGVGKTCSTVELQFDLFKLNVVMWQQASFVIVLAAVKNLMFDCFLELHHLCDVGDSTFFSCRLQLGAPNKTLVPFFISILI